MVVLLLSDPISKRDKRQLYLLTCRKCYFLLVDSGDSRIKKVGGRGGHCGAKEKLGGAT